MHSTRPIAAAALLLAAACGPYLDPAPGPVATSDPGVPVATSGWLANGDFETGALGGWQIAGAAAAESADAYGGAFAARVGGSGESAIAQRFALPSDAVELSLWYK